MEVILDGNGIFIHNLNGIDIMHPPDCSYGMVHGSQAECHLKHQLDRGEPGKFHFARRKRSKSIIKPGGKIR